MTPLARIIGIRRRVVTLVLLVALGAAAYWLWPRQRSEAGYPFARAPGGLASPLWRMSPEALDRLTADDAARLGRTLVKLDRALELAREHEGMLAEQQPEALDAAARRRVRDIWWTFLDPMLALDDLKARHEGWYGVDFLAHPRLHARSFAISFAALCAQTAAGHALLELIGGSELSPKLFDEAMPELGVPAGSFQAFRNKLGRTRDHSLVPVGGQWFEQWLAKHLSEGEVEQQLRQALVERRKAAQSALGAAGVARTADNETAVLKGAMFKAWFPLQRVFAEWAGDTRVAPEGRRLIADAQIEEMKKTLRPGDIVVERRNWYLSNIGLPGFWPHAALFSGSQDEIRRTFDGDESVRARFGTFSEALASRHPEAWRALGSKDEQGHEHNIVEAVSEGVVASSVQHSLGADYVAALRPSLPLVDVAAALDRALGYYGRPYDFDFNFSTDDQVVCSELVMKAYDARSEADQSAGDAGAPDGGVAGDRRGLVLPWVTVAGRRAVPPTEIVRVFAAERGEPSPQLAFVYFLDGREGEKKALVGDAESLAKTVDRPKWDLAQP